MFRNSPCHNRCLICFSYFCQMQNARHIASIYFPATLYEVRDYVTLVAETSQTGHVFGYWCVHFSIFHENIEAIIEMRFHLCTIYGVDTTATDAVQWTFLHNFTTKKRVMHVANVITISNKETSNITSGDSCGASIKSAQFLANKYETNRLLGKVLTSEGRR